MRKNHRQNEKRSAYVEILIVCVEYFHGFRHISAKTSIQGRVLESIKITKSEKHISDRTLIKHEYTSRNELILLP